MANSNKPKTSQAVNIAKVSQMDVCQTPPHALEPLYPYIPKDWIIWESAAGPEQLIANTLRANGYNNVIATDLSYGEQYNRFSYRPEHYDIEWTNPGFSIKYKWLEQAFEDGMPFALLAPYETTFAKDFQKLFQEYNSRAWLVEILSPERRINYKMPNNGWKGTAQMPTCWITWGLNISNSRNDYLRTFYVPMRNVKYNDDNTEKKGK